MGNEVVKHKADIRVSIDRITIVGNYASDRLDNDMREWLRKPFVQDVNGRIQVVDDSNCYQDDFGNRHAYVAPEQVAFISSQLQLNSPPIFDVNRLPMPSFLFNLFVILTDLLTRSHRTIIRSFHLTFSIHYHLFTRTKSPHLIIFGCWFIK